MQTVDLTLDLTGYYCNRWPQLQIIHHDKVIQDLEIQDHQILHLTLSCHDTDCVTLYHHGKRFGDQDIWDTSTDGSQDCYLQINDIKFDQVSVGEKIMRSLIFNTEWNCLQQRNQSLEFIEKFDKFASNGRMSFNGRIEISFQLPIYNWLIMQKYKEPKSSVAATTAYFSTHVSRYHYDRDLEIIKEIKEMMKF